MESKKDFNSGSDVMAANTSHEEDIDVEKHNGYGHVDTAHGFSANQETLPKGYYRSLKFIGTMTATGLGLASAVGGFGLAAPALTIINNEIGPDPNIIWVSLVYTLTLAVGLILVGRLSDLFGRRVSSTLGNSKLVTTFPNITTVVFHRHGFTFSYWMHRQRYSAEC
jgi:hypothetical protein